MHSFAMNSNSEMHAKNAFALTHDTIVRAQNRHVEEIVSEPAQQERLLKSVKYQQPEEYKEIVLKILNDLHRNFRASLADKHALTSYDFQFLQRMS